MNQGVVGPRKEYGYRTPAQWFNPLPDANGAFTLSSGTEFAFMIALPGVMALTGYTIDISGAGSGSEDVLTGIRRHNGSSGKPGPLVVSNIISGSPPSTGLYTYTFGPIELTEFWYCWAGRNITGLTVKNSNLTLTPIPVISPGTGHTTPNAAAAGHSPIVQKRTIPSADGLDPADNPNAWSFQTTNASVPKAFFRLESL